MKQKKNNYGDIINNVDAMQEILSHLDADALAMASCVCRRWHQAAIDDSLWEVICTKHWPATAIPFGRIRCVVNVMGGFRRLYVNWLHPLRRSAYYHNDSAFKENNLLWSEDQVQLSLSLFSVEYYKKLGSFTTGSCHKLSAIPSVPSIL
ncbi:hypothetical protein SUGI_0660450 [Cryptomeria japonica]|nr:hypothetical protein SUGI_0660450 [Cryptomeria japonica]